MMETWKEAIILTFKQYPYDTASLFGKEFQSLVESRPSSRYDENHANQIISHYIKTTRTPEHHLLTAIIDTIIYDKASEEFIMEWKMKGFEPYNRRTTITYNSSRHVRNAISKIYHQYGWSF